MAYLQVHPPPPQTSHPNTGQSTQPANSNRWATTGPNCPGVTEGPPADRMGCCYGGVAEAATSMW